MSQNDKQQGVGASLPLPAIVAGLVSIVIIVGGIFSYRHLSTATTHPSFIIATGPQSGVYHALGKALQRVLHGTGEFDQVKLQTTDGSVENMNLIGQEQAEVDIAFIQGDASPSSNARLITVLYDEVLHILVSKAANAGINDIYGLQGKRVAMGNAGSGTRELSHRILEHFGVDVAEDLIMSPTQAAEALVEGRIDAAFMLTAIPSELIVELARRDAIRFLSLGDAQQVGDEAHALELVFPGIKRDTIPRATYVRLPFKAVHTVSVAGMLVAHKDLDEELVRSITDAIFSNRSGPSGLEGSNLMVARKIMEDYDPASVAMPYHPGSAAYYRREEPPFFVEYAEALSLGLTLMLALYSVSIAVREWIRRRMKNRVDAYLLQVEQLAAQTYDLDQSGLRRQLDALHQLRRRAFTDLVNERLLADEAFIILQNHMRDELVAIEAMLLKTQGEQA